MNRQATAIRQYAGNGIESGFTSENQTITSSGYLNDKNMSGELGISPQELLAAAYASCFTMNFACKLNSIGLAAELLETTCFISYHNHLIVGSHLYVKAKIDGIDQGQLECVSRDTELTCTMSNALGIIVTMELELID
jgi:organic hydroperoxide reductase OsmC/OhrA